MQLARVVAAMRGLIRIVARPDCVDVPVEFPLGHLEIATNTASYVPRVDLLLEYARATFQRPATNEVVGAAGRRVGASI